MVINTKLKLTFSGSFLVTAVAAKRSPGKKEEESASTLHEGKIENRVNGEKSNWSNSICGAEYSPRERVNRPYQQLREWTFARITQDCEEKEH